MGYLSVRDVSKIYYGKHGQSLLALEGISLDAAEGEFITIVGPSGCGKSTLLKLIAGLVFRSGGEIWLGGRIVSGPRVGVGMVFQNPILLKWKTVLGNVMFPVKILGLDEGEYRKKAFQLLEMAGLSEFADRYPRELSGGMQQRVSICRALVFNPSVLLMDEPFGALDAMTREDLGLELLRIWQEERKTVLFVTHSIPEAVLLGDRVVVMSARPGRIVDVIEIDLPRPRLLALTTTDTFQAYVYKVRSMIKGSQDGRPREATGYA